MVQREFFKSLWSSYRDQIQCDPRCKATVDPNKPVISMGFLSRDQGIVHLIQVQHLLNVLFRPVKCSYVIARPILRKYHTSQLK